MSKRGTLESWLDSLGFESVWSLEKFVFSMADDAWEIEDRGQVGYCCSIN